MVDRLRIFILFLLCLPVPGKAAELRLEIDNPRIELGKTVQARLYGVGLSDKLSHVDLTSWKNSFGIVIKDDVNVIQDPRWPNTDIQRLDIQLYPRSTGKLDLPAVHFKGTNSESYTIHVMPASNIEYAYHISSSSVWQRQQLLVTVNIITPDKYASLHADPLQIRGVEVVPLEASRETLASGQTQLQFGWALFPLSPGTQQFDLPPVKYRLSGIYQRQYYLPPFSVAVRALPPYIPPTIPVGKVSIHSQLQPAGLLRTDHLAHWTLQLQGSGVAPEWLPPVLRQVKKATDIQFLSADSKRSITTSRDGIHGSTLHTIHMKPVINGRLHLPRLRYQYFDPESGRLVTVSHMPPGAIALNLGWQIFIGAMILLLVVLAASTLLKNLTAYRARQKQRAAALEQLTSASDAHALRHALRAYSASQGWQANLSLQQFGRHWQARHGHSSEIQALLQHVAAASYGKHKPENLAETRGKLLAILH